jgi:hypothetical protein
VLVQICKAFSEVHSSLMQRGLRTAAFDLRLVLTQPALNGIQKNVLRDGRVEFVLPQGKVTSEAPNQDSRMA